VKTKLIVLLFLILFSNLILFNNQVESVTNYPNSLVYKYNLVVDILGNTSLSAFSIKVGYKYDQNVSGYINYSYIVVKNNCVNFSLQINGSASFLYKAGILERHGNYKFENEISNYTCDILNSISKILSNLFNNTKLLNMTIKNSSIVSSNYSSRILLKGLTSYSEFPSLNYTYVGNYSSLIKSNNSLTSLNYRLNSTVLNSLDYGFPLYVNTIAYGYYNTSYTSKYGISNVAKFEIKSLINLYSSSFKPTRLSNFNLLNLTTSIGVNFFIVSNKTIQQANVLGNQITLSFSGSGKVSLSILYGSPSLFIDYKGIKVINSTDLQIYKFSYLNYALIYLKTDSNKLTISLGANVGSVNYSSSSYPNFYILIYYILIAAVIIAVAITVFYLTRRKLKL